MNLVNAEYGINIKISENIINELVIENPESFSSIVHQFIKGRDGLECDWLLSNKDKILKLDKFVEIIENPLILDFDSRKIIGRLYSSMQDISNENPIGKNEINSVVVKNLEDIISQLPYDNISYNLDYDMSSLFKLYNVKIDISDNTLIENIVEYIKVLSFLCKINVVIFINLRCYLSKEKIIELYNMASYYNISMLLIEGSEREQLPDSRMVIIDNDNCLIFK